MNTDTIRAADLRPGSVVVSATLPGRVFRQRVTEVTRLDVTIHDPIARTRTVYPTVRATFAGGGSCDYAPDAAVQVLAGVHAHT